MFESFLQFFPVFISVSHWPVLHLLIVLEDFPVNMVALWSYTEEMNVLCIFFLVIFMFFPVKDGLKGSLTEGSLLLPEPLISEQLLYGRRVTSQPYGAVFYLTPLSDSVQNFSLDLELFPVSLETLSFLVSHVEVLTGSSDVGEAEFSRAECCWFIVLSKRRVIPHCELQGTDKLLYSTCFLCVSVFFRQSSFLLLLSFGITLSWCSALGGFFLLSWTKKHRCCFFLFIKDFQLIFRIIGMFCSHKIQWLLSEQCRWTSSQGLEDSQKNSSADLLTVSMGTMGLCGASGLYAFPTLLSLLLHYCYSDLLQPMEQLWFLCCCTPLAHGLCAWAASGPDNQQLIHSPSAPFCP